jgi:hypothetical protein
MTERSSKHADAFESGKDVPLSHPSQAEGEPETGEPEATDPESANNDPDPLTRPRPSQAEGERDPE